MTADQLETALREVVTDLDENNFYCDEYMIELYMLARGGPSIYRTIAERLIIKLKEPGV